MPTLTPCLWFNDSAEAAARFYVSIFKQKSRIKTIVRYGPAASKASGRPEGSVLTVVFELNGKPYMALNGGPVFKLSPAFSFVVNCKNQKEIDWYWKKLSAGGKPDHCGWLTDKFGVSWQVVPESLNKLLDARKPRQAEQVMVAILTMKKLDLKKLKKAAASAAQ